MNKPEDESNFLIEITPALYMMLKKEIGDAFIDNMKLHFSPYWKEMAEQQSSQQNGEQS